MHSRIGDEGRGSRWASLIICAEFYTTDEVGGGPGFGAVTPDMVRDVCLPRYAELLSGELHPLDDQQPFSRDDDPNLPSSLDFGRELESLELGLKTAGGRTSSR